MARMTSIALILVAISLIGCASDTSASERSDALEELAAEQNPKALYHLGMMYLTGTDVAQDQRRAVTYFKRAHDLGDPLASYKLGCFFDSQYQLLEVDPDRALALKLIAAEAGYALAQQDVARLYANQGQTETALEWLKRAADQGTSDALATYASVYNGASGVEKDPVKTAAYFRLYLQRTRPSEKQIAWLATFEGKLTPEQKEQVSTIVSNYRPRPTELTVEALSGLDAADLLVRQHHRPPS
jgi:uncharacterized protein